jgi:hypothetical protein
MLVVVTATSLHQQRFATTADNGLKQTQQLVLLGHV